MTDAAEFAGEAGEIGDFCLNLYQVKSRNLVDFGATAILPGGECKECTDLVECESQVSTTADETECAKVIDIVGPVVGGGSAGRSQKLDLFVVSNGDDLDSRFFGQIADCESGIWHENLTL